MPGELGALQSGHRWPLTPLLGLCGHRRRLFEDRVTGRRVRQTAFGASGRAATGFWRVCGRAHDEQYGGKGPPDAIGGEQTLLPGTFPGQAPVLDTDGSHPELGVGSEHQPRPAVGLLGMAHPGERPIQHLFG